MQRVAAVPLLALLLVSCLACAAALFEDQAGTFDWYKPYVGHVTTASFHKTKPRVYLATEQGVVGTLNLRDGSIGFRHKLGEEQAATAQLLDAPALFVSSVGSAITAWDPSDGAMKWEATLPVGKNAAHAAVLFAASGASPTVAVLGAGFLSVFDPATGSKIQDVELSEAAASATKAFLHPTSTGAVTAYTYTPGESTVYITSLQTVSALTSSLPLSGVAAAGPDSILILSADYTHACVAGLGGSAFGESSFFECTTLANLGPVTGSVTSQVVATTTGYALASGDPSRPGAVVVKLEEGGALTTLAKFESGSAVSEPYAAAVGELVAVVEVTVDGAVKIQYVGTEKGAVAATEGPIKGARSDRLAPGVTPPGVRAAVIGGFKKRDQSEGYRALLIWQDERISLVQQGVTVWSRDEALGGVTAAVFSDLPPGQALAAGVAAQIGTTTNPDGWKDKLKLFLRMQLLSAQVQFKLATSEEVSEFTRLRTELSDKQSPTRDARGFRRALVVATSSGKVAALHNGDGRVLWSRPGPLGRRGENAAPQHLLHWRSYHDLQHAPQVAILTKNATTTTVSVLEVYTGKELETVVLPYTINKLIALGHVDEGGDHADQELYLAVHVPEKEGARPVVHLLPDTPVARSHFQSKYRSLFFFLDKPVLSKDGPSTAFHGYGFDKDSAAQLSAGKPAAATPSWSLLLPDPVITWAAVDPTEPVHTSVKVLGDRSMKYRYLNPNTMVVVTGTPEGRSSLDDGTAATIYIIDTVTGSVRHSQTAPSCRGPAVAMITENLALVQMWDSSAARFSITSLELYDASERSFSVLDHMFNPNSTAPQSSFDPPPLEVLTASFFTRTPSKALTSTRTRAGITSKLLIGLMHTDQVFTLDMRFVDPRRPRSTKLTPEQQEERLIPYTDTLPMVPPQFASFNKQVLGLKASICAPSRLESTSLLFSYGTDLQYTRVAPAKGFDSLDEDFSYALLVVALIGLTGASVFLHVFTKKATLKAKWQ